ncbi:MAG: carbohydrate kinase family protein [Ignavibacteria bacterium]|nr:carbohydrate kinase family protein [Ignavibacteria bacterium]
MQFLVIGEPCVDLIHKYDGEVITGYGGILYSVISLAVLANHDDIVKPVMNLGGDEHENVINILKEYSNINLDGVYKVDHPTRKVSLFYNMYYSGHSARMETSTAPTYTLEYEKIERFITESDAVLVNMISGIDITLDTMIKIRKNFQKYIHIDIHNLVMSTNKDGTREYTNLQEWRKWCSSADIIQMNEFEVKSMSRIKKNEYGVVEEILIHQKNNVKGVIITKGKLGVSGYVKKEKSFGNQLFFDLDKYDVSAIENPKFKDSTGCGDVFASAFTIDYCRNNDFIKSLYYATRISSYKTSLEGIEELYKLR